MLLNANTVFHDPRIFTKWNEYTLTTQWHILVTFYCFILGLVIGFCLVVHQRGQELLRENEIHHSNSR